MIARGAFDLIRSKDGVHVYRVPSGDASCVLKYFENEPDRREIENYRILNELSVPTIRLIAHTDCALLMEDIAQSSVYRLGAADDLNDAEAAVRIAQWYRRLHNAGKAYVASRGGKLYAETDVITQENIERIISITETEGNPAWDVLRGGLSVIKRRVDETEWTLTYNDFYYTNLVVAKDKTSALMFDYNLLGKGYAYADIRNVCSSLGEEAKAAFLDAYGGFSAEEAMIDDVASALVTLHFACQRSEFPQWARGEVERVKNGELLEALERLLAQ